MLKSFLATSLTLSASLLAQPATQPMSELSSAFEKPMSESLPLMQKLIDAKPQDDSARLALGMMQTIHAVETLCGSLHEYGVRGSANEGMFFPIPLPSIPIPENDAAKPVSAAAIDTMLAKFRSDLDGAIATLKQVDDASVKLPVRVGMIPLDVTGDGKTDATSFDLLPQLQGGMQAFPGMDVDPDIAKQVDEMRKGVPNFVIAFDAADARWLEGCCHTLNALAGIAQAYEKKDLVERSGQILFAKVDGPYGELLKGKKVFSFDDQGTDFADLYAMIHLLNMPVRDANALAQSHQHLLAAIDCSRKTFAAIRVESDNDREWIPSEKQTSALGDNFKLQGAEIDAWLAWLDESEAVLEGKELIPWWRGDGTKGVNLKKVFTQPSQFDLILWLQGTAAVPYLEAGDLADGAAFNTLNDMLDGEFFTLVLWLL